MEDVHSVIKHYENLDTSKFKEVEPNFIKELRQRKANFLEISKVNRMQNNVNVVSIFCGKFPSEQAFLDYIEFDYSLNDDQPPSQFMADFSIDWYDEDLAEASFIENGLLADNIPQHSYAQTFDKKFKIDSEKFNDYNSLYLISDFDASNLQQKNAKLTLMGVYAYQKPIQ